MQNSSEVMLQNVNNRQINAQFTMIRDKPVRDRTIFKNNHIFLVGMIYF